MTDEPTLVHGVARFVLDPSSPVGLSFWIGGPTGGNPVTSVADLPGHGLELHVFDHRETAEGFALGVARAGGNRVAASHHGHMALLARLDDEVSRGADEELGTAIPVASVRDRSGSDMAGSAMRSARSAEEAAARWRADAASTAANERSWEPLAAVLAAMRPMDASVARRGSGIDGPVVTARLRDRGRSGDRVTVVGSFDPSGATRGADGLVREYEIRAVRNPEGITLEAHGWRLSPEDAAPRREAFAAAAAAAGWTWDPVAVSPSAAIPSSYEGLPDALVSYPSLVAGISALVEECVLLGKAREALADVPGMSMLRGLALDPSYSVKQYSRNDPARMDTPRGGRSVPAKVVTWAAKPGFIEIVSSRDEPWGKIDLSWKLSAKGRVAVAGDPEELAPLMRDTDGKP